MLNPSAQEQDLSKRYLQNFTVWLCHELGCIRLLLYPKMSQVYSHKTFVKKKKSNLIPWG